MSLNKKSIDDINVKGLRVLCRCDFNVPLKEGKITELKLVPRGSASIYEVTGKLDGYKENETFYAKLPLSETIMERIIAGSLWKRRSFWVRKILK